jgi:hypothetical protein
VPEADNHQRGWGAVDDQVLRRIAHEGRLCGGTDPRQAHGDRLGLGRA